MADGSKEEFQEDEDEERMECLGKILDECDHTDLKILRDYEKLSQLIEDYFEMLYDPNILLTKMIEYALCFYITYFSKDISKTPCLLGLFQSIHTFDYTKKAI